MSDQIDWVSGCPSRSGIYWVYSKTGTFRMAALVRWDDAMEVVIPLDIPGENNGQPRAWCTDWKRSPVPITRPEANFMRRGNVIEAQ